MLERRHYVTIPPGYCPSWYTYVIDIMRPEQIGLTEHLRHTAQAIVDLRSAGQMTAGEVADAARSPGVMINAATVRALLYEVAQRLHTEQAEQSWER